MLKIDAMAGDSYGQLAQLKKFCRCFLIPYVRLGLQIHLAQSKEEQIFINSLTTFSSNWLRIQFNYNKAVTNDKFQGQNQKENLVFKTERIFKDLVVFELWDEDPFFLANENLDSAISITGSHWLGSGSTWINCH